MSCALQQILHQRLDNPDNRQLLEELLKRFRDDPQYFRTCASLQHDYGRRLHERYLVVIRLDEQRVRRCHLSGPHRRADTKGECLWATIPERRDQSDLNASER